MGDVNWVLLGSLLLGSIPGIMMASHFAHHLPERVMRSILGFVLVVIGTKLLLA